MSLPASITWDKVWLWNVSQMLAKFLTKRRSVIGNCSSPVWANEPWVLLAICSHQIVATPYGEHWGNSRCKNRGYRSLVNWVYQKNDFSEPRLLYLPICSTEFLEMLPPGFEVLKNSCWIKRHCQLLDCEYFKVYKYKEDTFQKGTKEYKSQHLEHWHQWWTIPERSIWWSS